MLASCEMPYKNLSDFEVIQKWRFQIFLESLGYQKNEALENEYILRLAETNPYPTTPDRETQAI